MPRSAQRGGPSNGGAGSPTVPTRSSVRATRRSRCHPRRSPTHPRPPTRTAPHRSGRTNWPLTAHATSGRAEHRHDGRGLTCCDPHQGLRSARKVPRRRRRRDSIHLCDAACPRTCTSVMAWSRCLNPIAGPRVCRPDGQAACRADRRLPDRGRRAGECVMRPATVLERPAFETPPSGGSARVRGRARSRRPNR